MEAQERVRPRVAVSSCLPGAPVRFHGIPVYAEGDAVADRRGRGVFAAAIAEARPSLATEDALNAAWPPLFFRACNPRLALAEILALNLSNALLTRRFLRQDRAAGLLLLPYAGWTVFATALNAAIARRNPEA